MPGVKISDLTPVLSAPSDASVLPIVVAGTTKKISVGVLKTLLTNPNFVSVKDFGAIGDGATDDTSAIEAAIAFCKGGTGKLTLYFPAGTYNFSESTPNFGLYINAAIKIVGDGPTRTILKNTSATGAGIRCASGFITIQDLTIDQNGSTGNAFRCPGQYSVVNNVQITNQAGAGYAFVVDGSTLTSVTNLHIVNATNGISIGPTTPAQYITFTHCSVEFTQRGLTSGTSSNIVFNSLYFEPVNGTTSFVHVMSIANSNNWNFYTLSAEVFGVPSNAGAAFVSIDNCRSINVFGGRWFNGTNSSPSTVFFELKNNNSRNINFSGLDFDTQSSGLTLFNVINNMYNLSWRDIRVQGAIVGNGIDMPSACTNVSVQNWVSSNFPFTLYLDAANLYACNIEANTNIVIGGNRTNMVLVNCAGTLSGAGIGSVTRLDTLFSSSTSFRPKVDNTMTLGFPTNRWSVVYAVSSTINTSDEREKQQIRPLTDSEKATAKELQSLIRAFKFNSSVEKKNNDARIHIGVTAQQVGNAFLKNGLDPRQYGIFCHDSWPETEEQKAGDRYGIRYEELFAFILGAL